MDYLGKVKRLITENYKWVVIILIVLLLIAYVCLGYQFYADKKYKKAEEFASAGNFSQNPSGAAHNLAILSSAEYDVNPYGANRNNEIEGLSSGRQKSDFESFDASGYRKDLAHEEFNSADADLMHVLTN